VTFRLRNFVAATIAVIGATIMTQPATATTIERVVSPGGIEAWLVHEPSLPLVAMSFAFLGGAAEDPAEKPGVGYMVASLLDEGAGELDSKAFQRRLDDTATELRFSVTQDYFYGSIRMLSEQRDQSFDLLRLALNHPRFDADAIARIREEVMSGLRRETTDPGSIASQTWWRTAFPHHPYGQPNNGTLASVPTIGLTDLQTYTGRMLARSNLKVAAVGDIDAATLGQTLDRVFGELPAEAKPTTIRDRTLQGGGKRVVVSLNVPQSVVRMGGAGVPRKDPDFMAAYIVNHILGGGSFTSRLYGEVREKRGLVYGVSSYLLTLRHSALFMVSTQASNEHTREAVDLIEAAIRRMADEGPTEAELSKAKAYLKGAYVLNLDTSGKIASVLLQNQLDDLGIDYIDRRQRMIDAVTVDDARRAAKRLGAGGLLTTVVGEPKDLASREPGP